jgi:hypothetical protein|tara:strand:+ start:115 stop:453 length:339 start_codon:yes stop_codon:yes gene_type:complete
MDKQTITDLSIKCVDKIVEEGIIKDCTDTNRTTEFDVQDIITDVLCNYFKYNEPKNIPDAGSIGAVRINLLDDEIDDIESGEIELEYPYSISDNELWIWEQDKEKAEADFGY